MPPLIAVVADFDLASAVHRLADAYTAAVERAGGTCVILPVGERAERAFPALERVDGVVLSGGGDLDAALFGLRPTAQCGPVDPRRDAFELALCRHVLARTQLALLGVCRGCQVLNVALGGTLYPDLVQSGLAEHRLTMYPRAQPSHAACALPGTRLASIVGGQPFRVNSFHHQAVDRPGRGLLVSARSLPDGAAEAVELPGGRFVLGVQWHPESLADDGVFAAFVAAACGAQPGRAGAG